MSDFDVADRLLAATGVPAERLFLVPGNHDVDRDKINQILFDGLYRFDILVVDGNPLEDITVLGASTEWFNAPPPQPVETLRVIDEEPERLRSVEGIGPKRASKMPPQWEMSGCRMAAARFSRISRKPHLVKMRSPVARGMWVLAAISAMTSTLRACTISS